MNKLVALSMLLVSGSSVYARHTPAHMQIQDEIRDLEAQIQAKKRDLADMDRKTKYAKKTTKLREEERLQEIDAKRAAKAAAAEAKISERKARIGELKEELSEIE